MLGTGFAGHCPPRPPSPTPVSRCPQVSLPSWHSGEGTELPTPALGPESGRWAPCHVLLRDSCLESLGSPPQSGRSEAHLSAPPGQCEKSGDSATCAANTEGPFQELPVASGVTPRPVTRQAVLTPQTEPPRDPSSGFHSFTILLRCWRNTGEGCRGHGHPCPQSAGSSGEVQGAGAVPPPPAPPELELLCCDRG